MKYKVMYTAGAKRDLRNIFRYISEELLAPENAAGQTDRIMAAIRKLDTMPNRNRLYEEAVSYTHLDVYKRQMYAYANPIHAYIVATKGIECFKRHIPQYPVYYYYTFSADFG